MGGGKGRGTIQTYKETSYKEKRRYQRFNASTVLMIKEIGGFKVTKTVNLSLGGAKILSETRVAAGQDLRPGAGSGNKANPLRSDVIYSDKAAGESPYFYSGLRFKDLTPAEQKDLEAFFLTSCRKGTDN